MKFNRINGHFHCSTGQLTDLTNCPNIVERDFSCSYNKLTSLKGCPKIVNGDFILHQEYNLGRRDFTEKEIRKLCKVKGKIHL